MHTRTSLSEAVSEWEHEEGWGLRKNWRQSFLLSQVVDGRKICDNYEESSWADMQPKTKRMYIWSLLIKRLNSSHKHFKWTRMASIEKRVVKVSGLVWWGGLAWVFDFFIVHQGWDHQVIHVYVTGRCCCPLGCCPRCCCPRCCLHSSSPQIRESPPAQIDRIRDWSVCRCSHVHTTPRSLEYEDADHEGAEPGFPVGFVLHWGFIIVSNFSEKYNTSMYLSRAGKVSTPRKIRWGTRSMNLVSQKNRTLRKLASLPNHDMNSKGRAEHRAIYWRTTHAMSNRDWNLHVRSVVALILRSCRDRAILNGLSSCRCKQRFWKTGGIRDWALRYTLSTERGTCLFMGKCDNRQVCRFPYNVTVTEGKQGFIRALSKRRGESTMYCNIGNKRIWSRKPQTQLVACILVLCSLEGM